MLLDIRGCDDDNDDDDDDDIDDEPNCLIYRYVNTLAIFEK